MYNREQVGRHTHASFSTHQAQYLSMVTVALSNVPPKMSRGHLERISTYQQPKRLQTNSPYTSRNREEHRLRKQPVLRKMVAKTMGQFNQQAGPILKILLKQHDGTKIHKKRKSASADANGKADS